jgi:UDP:flavonoid glycosyltransferase YjiC (YdhE family)
MDRYAWTEDELAGKVMAMLGDRKMRARLKATSKSMRARHGPTKAARIIDALTRRKVA